MKQQFNQRDIEYLGFQFDRLEDAIRVSNPDKVVKVFQQMAADGYPEVASYAFHHLAVNGLITAIRRGQNDLAVELLTEYATVVKEGTL